MDGEMTPTEKKEFEAELLISGELKKEVEIYRRMIRNIEEVKSIPSDRNYMASIVPRFRLKQPGAHRKRYPAYTAIAAAAALILLFINLPRQLPENTGDNAAVMEEADFVLNDLTELYGNIDSVIINNEEYSTVINEMLLKELNISEEELDSIYYSTYYSNSRGITEISDEESQIIYDEIINKRFF
jgi:hypothetical protein